MSITSIINSAKLIIDIFLTITVVITTAIVKLISSYKLSCLKY